MRDRAGDPPTRPQGPARFLRHHIHALGSHYQSHRRRQHALSLQGPTGGVHGLFAIAHGLPHHRDDRPRGQPDPGIEAFAGRRARGANHEHVHGRGSADQRLVTALRTAMHDFLDTAMYFVIGVLITSVFNTRLVIQPDFQHAVVALAGNDWLAVPGLMGLAILLSLCSTTDAFIAANMQGFSWVSKLAFLVFGPMFDLKLLFMYSGVFKKRFVLALALALAALTGALCGLWALGAPRLVGI
jgi:hypothetical protein